MIANSILFFILFFLLLFIGKEIVGDIRNPRKGQVNCDALLKNVPKIKTRKMYSKIER